MLIDIYIIYPYYRPDSMMGYKNNNNNISDVMVPSAWSHSLRLNSARIEE